MIRAFWLKTAKQQVVVIYICEESVFFFHDLCTCISHNIRTPCRTHQVEVINSRPTTRALFFTKFAKVGYKNLNQPDTLSRPHPRKELRTWNIQWSSLPFISQAFPCSLLSFPNSTNCTPCQARQSMPCQRCTAECSTLKPISVVSVKAYQGKSCCLLTSLLLNDAIPLYNAEIFFAQSSTFYS